MTYSLTVDSSGTRHDIDQSSDVSRKDTLKTNIVFVINNYLISFILRSMPLYV